MTSPAWTRAGQAEALRGLFEKPERAFSSGCIRMERALELAVLLLDDPERWSAEAIGAAIAAGERRIVPVKRRVPVMLLYFSAAAEEDGPVHFRPDLYDRDPRVLAALGAPFRFSPVAAPISPARSRAASGARGNR
ncbi:MAG TPA: hypothetical protein VJM14_16365 [Burkholderiales bacterium]|nr:hypothetical protein [Burkholderiales bacterium]